MDVRVDLAEDARRRRQWIDTGAGFRHEGHVGGDMLQLEDEIVVESLPGQWVVRFKPVEGREQKFVCATEAMAQRLANSLIAGSRRAAPIRAANANR